MFSAKFCFVWYIFEYAEVFECFGMKIMVVGTELKANPVCS